MAHVFAISLQDQVEKYGAYLGIAAFFGLAVLTVLYFAQAREVERLRAWAGREPERAKEVVTAAPVATGAAVPTAGPVPAAEVSSGKDPSATAVPAAATAAGAASSLGASSPIDAGGEGGEDTHGSDGHPVEVQTEAEAGADAEPDHDPEADGVPAVSDVGEGAGAEDLPVPTDDAAHDTGEAPSISSGADRLGAEEVPSAPAAAVVASAPPSPPGPPAPAHSSNGAADPPAPPSTPAPRSIPAPRAATTPAARPSSRAYGATAAGRRTGTPVSTGRTRGRSGPTAALAIAGSLVTLAALVFLGTQLFGGPQEPAPRANVVAGDAAPSETAAPGSQSAGPSEAASRASTEVAVFNGTTTAGLALSMAERLQSRGYPEGARTGNFTPDPAAPDQLRETSTVYYAEGRRAQARDVGRLLSISQLEQIDDDLQSLAPKAKVLVIVGADKTR